MMMSLLGFFILAPSTLAAPLDLSCNLPDEGYDEYFIQALDYLEDFVIEKITEGLEDTGLGPLGNSLPVSNILDLKSDVFQPLFGNQAERAELFNVTSKEGLDIGQILEDNLGNLTGAAADFATLNVTTCAFNETLELFSLELLLTSPKNEWDLTDFSSASVAFLPDSLGGALDMSPPNLTLGYYLRIPLSVSLKLKKFFLGEVKANLSVELEAELSKSLEILPTESIAFAGGFDLGASVDYSSISGFLLSGDFSASLEATTNGTSVASLGLFASDNNIFDNTPRKFS